MDDPENYSFTIESYTTDTPNFSYIHDTVTTDLEVTFDCDYPCFTCEDTDATECLSCLNHITDGSVPEQYLYESEKECVEECPDKTYEDDTEKKCLDCDEPCATCDEEGICLTCNNAGDYPFFHTDPVDYCLSICPTPYCSVDFTCETPCPADEFLSVDAAASPLGINTASTLTFTAVLDPSKTKTTYAVGDLLFFTVPDGGTFTPDLTGTCTVSILSHHNYIGDRIHFFNLCCQCSIRANEDRLSVFINWYDCGECWRFHESFFSLCNHRSDSLVAQFYRYHLSIKD